MRRHRGDTATFEELDFHGQARAMNATALQLRKQFRAHLRRAKQEGRDIQVVRRTSLGVLERAIIALR
jgi:hypothetical protein